MKVILKKLGMLLITVWIISFLTFVCFSVIPGDAALSKLGVDATEEQIQRAREELGLDESLLNRYGHWLSGAVRGDFGESLVYDQTSVGSLIKARLPVTLWLSFLSLMMIVVFSIPIAVLSSVKIGGFWDKFITVLNQLIMAIPSFFLGILITFFLGIALKVFQPGNFIHPNENLRASLIYLFYPALCIAIPKIAMTVKFLKGSMEEESKKEYVRTARSKGLSTNQVFKKHILKNALIPVITFLGLILIEILAGSIVAEQVFSVPGLGRLLISSISSRDYPVVQAIVLYITTVVVVVNTLVDLIYRLVDPRIAIS